MMPSRSKRKKPGRARTRSNLPPKAPAHDALVDGGRPLKASEILMNPAAEARPVPKPLTGEELLTLSPEEFQIRIWPLTLSEFLTGSPDVWQKVTDRTPSLDRLLARVKARLILAYRETEDPEIRRRLGWEAWNEMQAAQAEAYTRQQRDTHEQTQGAGLRSRDVRRKGSDKWQTVARQTLKQAQGGDETLMDLARRMRAECLEDYENWAAKTMRDEDGLNTRLWKDVSQTEREDGVGYVPAVDTIVRFLRGLTKNQPQ